MKNKLTIELDQLIGAGILTPEKAEEIQAFYHKETDGSQNRLFAVFGVLGAVLVGLGIILILAHNWDDLSRTAKTVFAFVPLLVGQGLCAYSLLKKPGSAAWKESASAFLFFAIGASIALVSQIYNIPGDIASFTLTWMLLSLPLVYLMPSSIVSLFYLVGITYYASETGYWSYPKAEPYIYWLLLMLVLPYYLLICKNKPGSNFTLFHHWFVPLSVIITLGTLAREDGVWMFVAYMSLFGLLYMIGYLPFFRNKSRFGNGYAVMGSLGTIGLLLFLSFKWMWQELSEENVRFSSVEFLLAVCLTAAAVAFFVWKTKTIPGNKPMPMEWVFLPFFLLFFVGMQSPVLATVLANLLVFGIGLLTIRQGADENHLGILNYGLLIITALVICRFFDTNISFVIRGILFLLIGFGFFFVNYWLLKKRKAENR